MASRGERDGLRRQLRVVRVLTGAQFELDYGESALGYVWAVLKPLAVFSVLYVIFGRIFKFGRGFHNFALHLLIGIVIWTFFADATRRAMTSVVERRSLLRQISFPVRVIPFSVTATSAITLVVNAAVVSAFVLAKGLWPRLDWLELVPLLAELVLFSAGVALLLSVAYVRLRDSVQAWDLLTQIVFYLTPIIYPLGLLPHWAQRAELVNPIAQIAEDARYAVLREPPHTIVTATDVFGRAGELIPVSVAAAVFLLGLLVFSREEPSLAERV
jgi:ABC-2 type transport system permease protein